MTGSEATAADAVTRLDTGTALAEGDDTAIFLLMVGVVTGLASAEFARRARVSLK